MNAILIATDFSKASRNAALYGVQLAKAIDANIILFNAYSIPAPAPAITVSISGYDIMVQTKQKLQDEADRIHYINMPSVETICDEGEPAKAIISVANERKADFIIAGMEGNGKNFKKIFGSTATSLAKKSNIPVIIIPEESTFSNPKIILYASDNIPDTMVERIDQIKSITELFKPKFYIIRVAEGEYAEVFERINMPDQLTKDTRISDAGFRFPINTDVRHALNNFIVKHHINMLVMMPHKHGLLERLFKKSETTNMIFHTHIPLLILPETSLGQMTLEKASLTPKTRLNL